MTEREKVRKDIGVFLLVASIVLVGCGRSYPYLVTNNDCNCEEYTYRDPQRRFQVKVQASYNIRQRVRSKIELAFVNTGKDTLDLSQAYIKGTSENVKYQYNGKALPMPFVKIPPGDDYSITLNGEDTELVDEPWHKIAGERVSIELLRLVVGGQPIPTIVINLVPVNPKFSS